MIREWTRLVLCFAVSAVLIGLAGCQYYEEFRVKKTTADLKEEQASLLRDRSEERRVGKEC